MTRSLIPAIIAAAAAGLAPAQPLTEQFLYQGELTDNGAPADGNYDFVFRLFDAASGGSLIGNPISRTNIPVGEGYVETAVGFGGIGLIFDGDRRWLEVSVRPAGSGSFVTLGRTEVTATPYSSYAINAESADFAQFSGTTLNESYENGRTIDADSGPVSIINTDTAPGNNFADLELGGTGSRQGRLTLNNFNAIRTLEAGSFNPGGYVQGYGATGDTVWQIGPDASNFGGGSAVVYRRTGSGSGGPGTSLGIQLEGNWAGTERSRLIMYGDSSNIQLAMDQTGDSAVSFPSDAINAGEMFNEPGVASSASGGSVTLTPIGSTFDTIASATISCPTSGFVLAIGTLEAGVSHVQGIESSINFGVSDTSSGVSSSQDIELRIEGNSPSGAYDHPVTVHGVFPVNGGSRTFYLLGDQNTTGHTVTALDPTLSLVFIPTAYGTVNSSRPGPAFVPDELAPNQFGGLTPDQIMAGRAASEQANRDRIACELADMRTRMMRLEQELAAELASNGEGR